MRRPNPPAASGETLADAASGSRRSERGAVLVNMAIALLGLISFSALVVDYGVLWAARRQAQNAADAGAMAAAVSLAYIDFDNHDLARTAALNTARANYVWGAVPDIVDGDVTFPPCPPGSPVPSSDACVRVDVFRNQRAGGSPLPTIFGRLVGIADQGVKATATAQVLWGDSADCVKPWAIPDKWLELNPGPTAWDPDDEFNRYDRDGATLNPADFYEPPGENASNDGAGTGFTRESIGVNGTDYGLQITLKDGNSHASIAPGWYYPVVVDPDCVGGDCYRDAISGCAPVILGPGNTLANEPGNMIGPTVQGVDALIAQDPTAAWSHDGQRWRRRDRRRLPGGAHVREEPAPRRGAGLRRRSVRRRQGQRTPGHRHHQNPRVLHRAHGRQRRRRTSLLLSGPAARQPQRGKHSGGIVRRQHCIGPVNRLPQSPFWVRTKRS